MTVEHSWQLKGTDPGWAAPGSSYPSGDNARITELQLNHQPSALTEGQFSARSNWITHQNLLRKEKKKRLWAGYEQC